MPLTQCPSCSTPCFGEERCMTTCSNCGTNFKIPIGFQAKIQYMGNAKRRCDCGEPMQFSHMNGGMFNYKCPNGHAQDFF